MEKGMSSLLNDYDWFSTKPFGNSSGTTTSNTSSWANGSNLSGVGNYGLNTKQSIPIFKGYGKQENIEMVDFKERLKQAAISASRKTLAGSTILYLIDLSKGAKMVLVRSQAAARKVSD